MGTTVLVIGVAQTVLVGLALTRILDPGWTTFGLVGVLSGLGMAAIGVVAVRSVSWRRRGFSSFGWLAVIAGTVNAVAWGSLLGGTFFTIDLVRIAAVVAADAAFAVSLAVLRAGLDHEALLGLTAVATLVSARTIAEVLLAVLVFLQSGERSGSGVVVILLAVVVLFGWVVLAVWEVAVGTWLVRRDRLAAPSAPSGS